jgi:hypothetical protein
MGIRTLDDLRRTAPRDLRNLSDRDLVIEYTKRKNLPYEDIADRLGVPPSGLISEMGRQIRGSFAVDVPRMIGKGQQFIARELPGLTEALEAGASAQAAAQPANIAAPTNIPVRPSGAVADLGGRLVSESKQAEPYYRPDMRGRGLGGQALVSGARAVGPVLTTAPAALVPGGMPIAAAGLFGTSQAQETYEKLIEQGVPEDEAREASYATGAIQGGGEALATYVGGRLFKPLLGRAGGGTTAGVAAEMTDTGVIKPFAKGLATNLLVQPVTEVGQDVGTSVVESRYGAKEEDLGEIAKQSALGATGLTLLLGPFAIGAHVQRSNNAASLKAALSDDPTIPSNVRAQAIAAVNAEAQRQGVDPRDVGRWTQEQIELEDRRTDAIRRMSESVRALEVGAGINERLGIGVEQMDEASYTAQFEEAFNEPSGQFTYETLADGSQAPRELTMGEVMERQARDAAGFDTATDLLSANTKTAKEILADIRQAADDPLSPSVWRFSLQQVETGQQVAPGIFQTGAGVYTMAPQDTTVPMGREIPRGLGAPAGPAQRVTTQRPVEGIPGMTVDESGVYRIAEPVAPASAPPSVSPSATPAPGSFTPPAPTPAKRGRKPKAAVSVTPPAEVKTTRSDEIKTANEAKKEPVSDELATEIEGIINRLNASVASEKGEAAGRVTLPQGLFKGLVRMLRSPNDVAPIVYSDTGAQADPQLTARYTGTLRQMYDAAQRVLLASRDLASAQDNALKTGKDVPMIKAKAGAETIAIAEAQAAATTQKIVGLRQQLRNAIDELVGVSGGEMNAEALIAVLKSRTQKRDSKPVNPKRFRELAAMLKKKPGTEFSQKEYDTALDSLISRAWRAYKDGELDVAEQAGIVSSEPTRPSRESTKGAKTTPPLVAAEQGRASKPFKAVTVKQPKETDEEFAARQQDALDRHKARVEEGKGIIGVLNFFRGPNQPAFSSALATAIVQAMRRRGRQPKIEWIADDDKVTNPSYNPATDTIRIHKTASAEETLHESLHAGLQWLVYSNPKAPEVQRLMASLDKVMKVDLNKTNLTESQKAKAGEVIGVLRDILSRKGKGKETAKLDAVLELISYGNTLADFKSLLKQIPSAPNAEARTWRNAIEDVWNRIVSLAQSLLGVRNTVANDVLEDTIALLNKAATTDQQMPDKLDGSMLDIATTAFKKWFGGSKIVNAAGKPRVMYHGTAADIFEFKAQQAGAIFVTDDPEFARRFTGSSESFMAQRPAEFLDAQGMANIRKVALAALEKEEGLSFTQRLKFRRMINDLKSDVYTAEIDNIRDFPVETQMAIFKAAKDNLPSRANIIPVYVRAENPFDYQSPEHVQRVVERVKEIRGSKRIDANLLQDLSEGMWDRIEDDDVQSAIKSLGFDSFYIKESGRKNLAVYQPNQLKSQFNKGTFSTDSGNILEAAVSSNKGTEKAAGITASDYRSFSERIAPAALSTRFAFDTIGWDKNVAERITKGAAKLADMIRKDFPAAERLMIYMNATFSAGKYTAQQLKDFVVNKDVGYQQMERLANTVASRPADEVLKLIAYMDGNEKALDGVPNAEVLTRTATNVNKWMKEYIKELPKEDRAFFENKKFSETLLYATRTEQLARGSIGTGKLASVMGMKTVTEESLEGFQDWMAKNDEGDPILDGRFYQVFKKEGLKPGSVLEPAGFMSISTYEARGGKDPVGFVVDPTRQWWLSGGSKAKGYKFSSTMTAKQAIQENKADQLANAMRNTMSALAANYASKKLFDNLSEYGYEDGKPTALSVAFNDVAEIKEATGSTVREENILNASSDFSKIADVIRRYRRSGTWVRLPNSKSYGALAGKIIPGPVWTAMLDTSDTKPLYSIGVLNDAMRWFKKSKTSLNPGTHVTNIATNVTLAMMHDIPIRTLGKAAQMFVLYETSPSKLSKNELDMMSAFENSGAMLGNYSSVEVKKALVNAWQENMLMDDTSVAKRLAAFAKYEKSKAQQMVQAVTKVGKTIENVAAETYAAEDNIFRLAAFLTKVGDLQNVEKTTVATPEQLKAGGEFARSAFLDYNINSKAVKVARQSVLPFVSWPYAAAGLISRMALHQPWKIANLYLAYYLLDVGLAAMAGDDDDELRKAGPEYLRERMLFGMGPNMFVRLPFGDEQNPAYYKLGDYNPVEALTKGLPTNKFLGQSWIPAAVTPGGPFVSATLGLIGGVDPYTGKEIHKPTDSEWDKFLNAAKFSYDLVAPPFLSSRTYQKIKDIKDEKVSDTGVEPSSLYFARVLGLKAYNYDVDDSMIAQDKKVKSIEKDFKAAMRKARKEEYSKGYPDYDALDAELEVLRERMERRIAKVRGEELEELEDELDEE